MSEPGGINASRTFRAPTAKQVLSRISRELGPDAAIIAHRKTRDSEGIVWVEATASSDRLGAGTGAEASYSPGESARKRVARLAVLPALGLVFLLAAGPAAWKLLNPNKSGSPLPGKLSAAVIGFENNTGDGSRDFLSEVIPNLLITRLEQSGLVDAISWERMQVLLEQMGKGGPAPPIDRGLAFELCKKDRIDALVMGSFTKAGELFATDVKVLDVKTGKLRVSASSKGIGEESILQSQVDELGLEILRGFGFFGGGTSDAPVRIADITTDSMDAYYHYLRGRKSYSNENLKDARIFLERAVQLDPQFAMAHLYLASSLSISGERQASLKLLERTVSLSARATEKERLFIQGMAILMRPGDYAEGVRIFKEMIRLYPRDKDGPYGLGLTLNYLGNYDAGIEQLQRALELDPYDGKTLGLIATAYWNKRDLEQAIEYYGRQIAAGPGNGLAHAHMASVYLEMGKLEEALAKCEEAFEADPDFRILPTIAYIYALTEDYDKALRLMDRLVQVEKYRHFEKSLLYLLTGKRRQAEIDLRRLMEYAAATLSRQSEANALWVGGWVAFDRGEFERAAASFKGWLDIYAQEILPKRENAASVMKHWRAWQAFYLGLVDVKQGKLGAAKARLLEIESVLPDILQDYRTWVAYYRNFLEAEIALAEGDARKAILAGERPPSSAGPTERRNDWLHNVPFLKDVLARAYRANGDLDKAIAEYLRLISFNKKGGEFYLIHPRYHYRLAELYEEKRLKEEAVGRYERFLDLWKDADADIPEVGEARRRLARLKGGY